MLDTGLETLPRLIADAAEPLSHIDSPEFASAFDRFGDARISFSLSPAPEAC